MRSSETGEAFSITIKPLASALAARAFAVKLCQRNDRFSTEEYALNAREDHMMSGIWISDMSVADIMNRWPHTIRVFLDWHMHCVGCPIARFHTLADSAREHGYDIGDLEAAVFAVIEIPALTSTVALDPEPPLP